MLFKDQLAQSKAQVPIMLHDPLIKVTELRWYVSTLVTIAKKDERCLPQVKDTAVTEQVGGEDWTHSQA